jgi:hypothetical protein
VTPAQDELPTIAQVSVVMVTALVGFVWVNRRLERGGDGSTSGDPRR